MRSIVSRPRARCALFSQPLIRLTSVTHAFNQNQRVNVLPFTPAAGAVQVTAPANGNIAPPGHYLLFLVDTNGVPSVGSLVQLSGEAPPPPPPPPPPTQRFTLTVTKTGAEGGRGTVTSSPAGITCGSTCTAQFDKGTPVTLSARAVGNTRFTGWSGACTGTGACVVEMTADRAVTATFQRR